MTSSTLYRVRVRSGSSRPGMRRVHFAASPRSSTAGARSPATRRCASATSSATSGEFWLNLQKLYELRLAERENGAAIARLPTPYATWDLHAAGGVQATNGTRGASANPRLRRARRRAAKTTARRERGSPKMARAVERDRLIDGDASKEPRLAPGLPEGTPYQCTSCSPLPMRNGADPVGPRSVSNSIAAGTWRLVTTIFARSRSRSMPLGTSSRLA